LTVITFSANSIGQVIGSESWIFCSSHHRPLCCLCL